MGPALLDGTQDPPPPRYYPDALAGLVTGESTTWPSFDRDATDTGKLAVAAPVEVDRESVQRMLDVVMSDDDEASARSARPTPPPARSTPQPFLPAGGPPTHSAPGMVAPTWRPPARQRVSQALQAYSGSHSGPGRPVGAKSIGRVRKPKVGIIITAVVLIAIFGSIAFQIISEIFEAISRVLE